MHGVAILFPGHPYIESATALSNYIESATALSNYIESATALSNNYYSIRYWEYHIGCSSCWYGQHLMVYLLNTVQYLYTWISLKKIQIHM